MPTKDLTREYRRFRHKVGGVVGEDAKTSLALARAIVHARENDWEWGWVDDEHGWADARFDGEEIETCEGCILRDAAGTVLASLWGIWDADREYRRLVEAELAAQAMMNE